MGYYTTDIIDPDELTNFAVQSDGGAFAVWTILRTSRSTSWSARARPNSTPRSASYLQQIQKQVSDGRPPALPLLSDRQHRHPELRQELPILPTGNYRLWETWRDDV